MEPSSKPPRLFSRFNQAAKQLLAAAAIGLALGGSMATAETVPMSRPDTVSTEYEYNKDRTVRLTGPITKDSAIKVIEQLIALSKKDPNADIELRINSGGGSVESGFAIYDVMKSLPNDIRTVCEGEAQSMAAMLLSAGAQGKRFAYPSCQIMYHQPTWGVSGQISDINIISSQGSVLRERMVETIAADTGWSETMVRGLLERNFYPNTEEAQQMGFIDHIIKPKNPGPAPTPKSQLPDSFCDNPGRKHTGLCGP